MERSTQRNKLSRGRGRHAIRIPHRELVCSVCSVSGHEGNCRAHNTTEFFKNIHLHKYPINVSTPEMMVFSLDLRNVEHDGYCSDAGSDHGEWKRNVKMYADITEPLLKYFQEQEMVDSNGDFIDVDFLKSCLDSDEVGCTQGSGYCYYNGSRIVNSCSIRRCHS